MPYTFRRRTRARDIGNLYVRKTSLNRLMVNEEPEDARKWVGVRISKAMMRQVEDVIAAHPEFAWSPPNDFIRDATRRYMEYVHQQDLMKGAAVREMPARVEGVLEETLGEGYAKEFETILEQRTRGIDATAEPEKYMAAVSAALSEIFGPTVAKLVTQRMARGGALAGGELK